MTTPAPRPVALGANQPHQFYRGGSAIAALRGQPGDAAEFGPEDWVASTTTRFADPAEGLSHLPDGRTLRAAVTADPVSWLGPEHTATFGADPALLVKLLDAGQRLPVHCHPSDAFAREHFASHFGKTEAWLVIGTSGDAPTVYAGFREDVSEATAANWVSTQDSGAMLGALNPIPVSAGDTVLIPSGLPHAIGAGVFVVELQQPTDFSITLEWQGFLDSAAAGHLGIGFAAALGALDRSAWPPERLATLRSRRDEGHEVSSLLPPAAEPFFRAEALAPAPRVELPAGFGVLVVLDGTGTLDCASGDRLDLRRGSTIVVPHGAGPTTLAGDIAAIRALPPRPETVVR